MPPRPTYPPLSVERTEDVTHIRLVTEHLAEENLEAVGEELFGVAAGLNGARLTLDLGGVHFLTSTALGTLVALNGRVRDGGGRLVLANVTEAVYEIFDVTRLNQVLDVRRGPDDGSPARA